MSTDSEAYQIVRVLAAGICLLVLGGALAEATHHWLHVGAMAWWQWLAGHF